MTRKESKIIHPLVLILIIFLSLYAYSSSREKSSAETILSEGTLTEEQFFGEYTYRCYTGPPLNEDVFQIFHDDQLVYQSQVAFGFSLYPKDEYYSHGDDITGDGIPNLLVLEGGGGSSSFSDSCHVLSLGEECKLIQTLPVGEFVDLDQDSILEYLTCDGIFTFWHAGHADSPAPRMILAYREGQYRLAPDLMYQPLPEQEVITQKIQEVKEECNKLKLQESSLHCWHEDEVYLDPSVWGFMLDLLYTGHPQGALDFLDAVWPEGEEGKELFLIEFKQRLNSSKEWKRIRDELYQTPEEKALWTAETGTIKITSIPDEAYVSLDRDTKGKTPLTLSDIPLGRYHLILDKSGYEDWEEEILLSSTQQKEIEARLIAKTGDAIVKVWPAPDESKEAMVYLDGEYMGQGFSLIEHVSPGKHTVKVTKEGYKDWENILSFYPGETHVVLADLKDKTKQTPILVLIGLVIFTIVVLYYEGIKRKKNKKSSN